MFGEIREMHPLLTPKLTNATIKRAVRDYLNGGARKQRVVTKYGDISNWDVSNVTNMYRDSDELDRIRGSGRQTALVGGKYKVDFQTMTQTNTHTGFQRPVYRSYGIGEASVIHAQPVPVSGVVAVGAVVA